MIERALFSHKVDAFICLLAAIFISVPAPSLAKAFDSGWAIGPENRRHVSVSEQDGSIPGWRSAPKPDPRVKAFEPRASRAFGLLTGDKVHHQLLLVVQKPYELQRSSLPPSQWVNTWLELQDVKVKGTRRDKVNRYFIALDYQIFATPRVVTLDFIPGFELRFAGESGGFSFKVPDWGFSISPLLKPEPEAQSIAEIPVRADAPPPLVAARLPMYGLALFGGLSVAFGAYWLYFNQLWPFRRCGNAPFARASRELRAIKRSSDHEQALREGFRAMHQAFNRTAGEVVFAEYLERFFAARPAFASQRAWVEDFFNRSRVLFFSGAEPTAGGVDFAWLQSLCRQCRAAERAAR